MVYYDLKLIVLNSHYIIYSNINVMEIIFNTHSVKLTSILF